MSATITTTTTTTTTRPPNHFEIIEVNNCLVSDLYNLLLSIFKNLPVTTDLEESVKKRIN